MSRPKISWKALIISTGVGLLLSLLISFLTLNPTGSSPLAACCLAGLLYPLVGFLYGILSRQLHTTVFSILGGAVISAILVLVLQFLSAIAISPGSPMPAINEGITSASTATGYSSIVVIGGMIAGLSIVVFVVALSGATGAFLSTLIPARLQNTQG